MTDTSLYGGAAGIGYFYLQLYELTGAEKYLEEAEDAAEYLINTYEKEDVVNPGIYNGLSGQGIFTLLLYDKTGDERYLQFAKTLAEDSYTQSVKDEKGIHWNGWYDYMGMVVSLHIGYIWRKRQKTDIILNTLKKLLMPYFH